MPNLSNGDIVNEKQVQYTIITKVKSVFTIALVILLFFDIGTFFIHVLNA